MRLLDLSDVSTAAKSLEMQDSSETGLACPNAGTCIELTSTASTRALLDLLSRHADARVAIESDGRIALRFANGGTIVAPFDIELAALASTVPGIDAQTSSAASTQPSVLDVADGQVSEQSASPEGQPPSTSGDQEAGPTAGAEFGEVLLQGHGGSGASNSSPFGRPLAPVGGIGDETGRHGRDGLKHGEMGSTGHNLTTGVGEGVGHLTGLGDESLGRRNGETISMSENRGFPGEIYGVGAGIDHLWLLGDTE